jgi:hypothetical protein
MWKQNDTVHIYILQDKVPAVLRIYRDTLITVMKASIKSTVAEMLPVLISRPIDSDSVTGERAADSDGLIFFLNSTFFLHNLLLLTLNSCF